MTLRVVVADQSEARFYVTKEINKDLVHEPEDAVRRSLIEKSLALPYARPDGRRA